MKYTTKQELLDDITEERKTFSALLAKIPESRYSEPGVWGDGWNIIDLIAHLAEWHTMFLRWYDDGLNEREVVMPAPGFKWNETPALNRAIWEKHRDRSFFSVWADFEVSLDRIVELGEELSEAALLRPGHFEWTGENPLVTYLGPNTASHYRFASKVLKRWLRAESGKAGGRDPGAGR